MTRRRDPVQKTGHRSARTDREARAMYALVQHRAIQVDLLAQLLNTGANHVYELRADLESAGLVHTLMRVGPGPKWIVPTRTAVTQFFGTSRPDWRPSPLWSVRGRAITRARLALGATAFDAWESERELAYRAQYPHRYPYDGRTTTTGGVSRAVLVLGARDTAVADLADVITRAGRTAADDGCSGLLVVHRLTHHAPADETAVHTAVTRAPLPVSLTVTIATLADLIGNEHTSTRPIPAGQRLRLVG
ncbi:hypothetical protein F3087_00730 [Nocardia colli]|uniref:Uncharacterized protein n=1 Tax=Nocardia colli TaxID=2545717 RepID=A0A5N0EKH4_9NOCA|nr:hypothetical protein [Nocardia colli]KAA8889887.1 hypothetical protein F3087_00730 [Nocardia colli]